MSDDSDDKTVVLADGAAAAPPGGMGGGIPTATLHCVDAGQLDLADSQKTIMLRDGHEVVLGRDPGCQVHIASPKLSRRHARVFAGSGTWGVEDLNSTNGVFVNGQKINAAWLHHGDELRIGPITFRYELERPGATAAPAAAVISKADDDESERTMMVGSLQASEAVLAAAREREAEKVRKAETEAVAAREAAPPLPSHRRSKTPMYVGFVVVLALAAGVGWYIFGSGTGEVDALTNRSNALNSQVVQKARERGSNLGASFADDHQRIAALLVDLDAGIARHAKETGLKMGAVRLRFLDFERDFAERLAKGDTAGAIAAAQAMVSHVRAVEADLPADGPLDEVRMLADLAELARVLGEFRAFTRTYPTANANAPAQPDAAELERMNALKQEFGRLRRTHNSPLQVTYVVLRDLVRDIDDRDVLVINDWWEVVGR